MPFRNVISAALVVLAYPAPAALPLNTKTATDAVRNATADPLGVQFRQVVVKGGLVCGEYNAKNSYGAYTGFHNFVFDPVQGQGFMMGVMARISRSGMIESGGSIVADVKRADHQAASALAIKRMNKLEADLREMILRCA
jgi:hypothetical protein